MSGTHKANVIEAAANTMLRIGFAVLSLSLCILSNNATAAPQNDTIHIRATVRSWLQQYVAYYEAHHLEPDAMFTAPTIWLFGPDGKMADVATVANDPDLENRLSP